ncbi:WLM domain [Musa troglodytarum]|uniref:WLM domain n=1 Tax=Musa troglodytarum TaxID=320322 RepID=A0A9E7JS92_9LILI|nr:WLM domain [Musa troglodytarum]URD92267.1 WLM domain [Musa troglodytarum]
MEQSCNILVIWRGKQFDVNVNPDSNVKEFGQKLQELTNVRPDTMRLFVPQKNNKGSKMLSPFSDVHSMLSLQESAILEGKTIKMMGVFSDEVDEVSHDSNKPDLRIAGFAEEEQRLRQRATYRPQASLKLPQGTYIFCEFRTLRIPGIELNPPPSEALRRMHMLACDPGIIAIMNKHRWRVGIMSEMAPEGYVGISPKCILGFNKNHGEEICLRLRTDDLQGFRKYESIKRTLLHELAHMVYSEHDSNFFALNKQLNEEAASLDWTKSTSHTLSGRKYLDHYEAEDYVELSSKDSGQKLGGATNSLVSARASSIAAACNRMANASIYDHMPAKEPDPDDSQLMDNQGKFSEPGPDDMVTSENDVMLVDTVMDARRPFSKSSMLDVLDELDPHDSLDHKSMSEPDPDDSLDNNNFSEPDPDDSFNKKNESEPDPDDCLDSKNMSEPDPDDSLDIKNMSEPNPDDSHARGLIVSRSEPDPDDTLGGEDIKLAKETDSEGTRSNKVDTSSPRDYEPDPDDSLNNVLLDAQMEEMHHGGEPDLDDVVKDMVSGDYERLQQSAEGPLVTENSMAVDHVNDLDNQELQRIEEPAALFCSRLQRAIDILRSEATPLQATSVLQTLFRIIRNVIEHPDEVKFRRLRKANPQFQRNVANYKAAMEVLTLVGFCEDVISDEVGRAETFLVLKRNDPGLLWLAKSSLELSIA